jgi:TATA-binding protein-associated factor Taf7
VTKKLTSFFVLVANGDNNNEEDEQQDTNDNSSEDEEEATLNAARKDSQRLTDAIAFLEQQRQKSTQKGESAMHSLQRFVVLAYLHLVKNGQKWQSASAMMATSINSKGAYYAKVI